MPSLLPKPDIGAIQKLKITAYSNINFSSQVGEIEVAYNPGRMVHKFEIEYDTTTAIGASGAENKYRYSLPETVSFELTFDSTFEIKDSLTSPESVATQIDKFKKMLYTYNGSVHRPNYVKLSWNSFIFKGQLASLKITYTGFAPDGQPKMAKALVYFIQVHDTASRLSAENKSSPDMTHVYSVKEGDTLPAIAHQIYGDPLYYLEVAQANDLDSFRKLMPGQQLILPPLDK